MLVLRSGHTYKSPTFCFQTWLPAVFENARLSSSPKPVDFTGDQQLQNITGPLDQQYFIVTRFFFTYCILVLSCFLQIHLVKDHSLILVQVEHWQQVVSWLNLKGVNLKGVRRLHKDEFWVLCCLMTHGLGKAIQYHVWPNSNSVLANSPSQTSGHS